MPIKRRKRGRLDDIPNERMVTFEDDTDSSDDGDSHVMLLNHPRRKVRATLPGREEADHVAEHHAIVSAESTVGCSWMTDVMKDIGKHIDPKLFEGQGHKAAILLISAEMLSEATGENRANPMLCVVTSNSKTNGFDWLKYELDPPSLRELPGTYMGSMAGKPQRHGKECCCEGIEICKDWLYKERTCKCLEYVEDEEEA